jgi:hypothetical protein
MTFSAKAARLALTIVVVARVMAVGGAAESGAVEPGIAALEQAVTANPEDLRLCADYRQRIIASGSYDRAIGLFSKLSERPAAGPNVQVSLALAYVDKVPVASPFKRIFLGRDAMRALSRAIERQPSLVAYYIRGLIALYYPEAVFHRARGGIADLEQARDYCQGAQPYHARVSLLGDSYWKVKDLAHARSIWTDGATAFPPIRPFTAADATWRRPRPDRRAGAGSGHVSTRACRSCLGRLLLPETVCVRATDADAARLGLVPLPLSLWAQTPADRDHRRDRLDAVHHPS